MLEYYAKDGFLNALLPTPAEDGASVMWHNRGIVEARPTIDDEYWTKSTFLGSTTGHTFNRYCAWVPEYAGQADKYQLFDVSHEKGSKVTRNTCVDFCWKSFEVFAEFGMVIVPVTKIRGDSITLISSALEVVSTSDKTEHQKIMAFYTEFARWLSEKGVKEPKAVWDSDMVKGVTKPLVNFMRLAHNHVFYVYINDDKYWKVQLTHPFVKLEYGVKKFARQKPPAPTNKSTCIASTCTSTTVTTTTTSIIPAETEVGAPFVHFEF